MFYKTELLILKKIYQIYQNMINKFKNNSQILTELRYCIRTYDIEDSAKTLGSIYWQGVLYIALTGCLFNFHIMVNFCNMDKKKYFF